MDERLDDATGAVLITADELAAAIAGARSPVLLDVRWQLGGPPGHEEYRRGHLPGAVYVDLETELARSGRPTDGRHPLPDAASFEAAARRWGVSEDSLVVAYDAGPGLAAARAWWLLRWAGHDHVRLLDGGLAAWSAAGHPLTDDEVEPAKGDLVVRPGRLPVLDLDDVAAWPDRGILLDARAGERYRGEVEPIDPKAGHVPGAVSAPTTENVDASGRFLAPDVLRQRFRELGVDDGTDVAVYCGSGVTAAHEIAALAVAGIDARLFAGSWSQWSNHDLPVATSSS